MASVSWDARRIFLIDYLEKGKNNIEEYNAAPLNRLKIEIVEKRPRMAKKGVVSAWQHIGTFKPWRWEKIGWTIFYVPPARKRAFTLQLKVA